MQGANAMSLPKNDVMMGIDSDTYEMLQQRAKALGMAVDELANRYLVKAMGDAERSAPELRRRIDAIAYYEAEMGRKW